MIYYIAIIMTILLVSTYYRNKEWEKYIDKTNKEVKEWREQVLSQMSDIKEQVQCSMHLHRLNQDDVVYRKWWDDKTYYNKSICKEIDSIIQELANNSWEVAEKTTDKLINRRNIIKDNIETSHQSE